jgi:hypothetical protein
LFSAVIFDFIDFLFWMIQLGIMKGLSLSIIGGMVLALVGVTVMIALFTDISPLDSDSGFCSVFNGLSPSLPESITPSVSGCSEGPEVSYKKLDVDDASSLSLKMAAGLTDCWNEFKGYEVDFQRCKAWEIPGIEGKVNESYLNNRMMENEICGELIENNAIDSPAMTNPDSITCGESNDIVFRPDEITGNTFLIIGFNSSTDRQFVEVQ